MVENISKFFGEEPWFYYVNEIKVFVFANEKLFPISMFGVCMYTIYTLNGEIGKNRFPFLLTFVGANFLALSSVVHKE